MVKPKAVRLSKDERIIAVVPEVCAGPGWSNAPCWVYVIDKERRLRIESIQPNERTDALHALYGPGDAMCRALVAAVPVIVSMKQRVA